MTAAVLAVDGGNSKTDVAIVAADGTLLAAVRGRTTSHQAVGLEEGLRRLTELVETAARQAGLDPAARPIATLGVHALAGADFAADIRMLERGLHATGLTARDVVVNDCIGALWAGATDGYGIALVCGAGINAAAVAPDGRVARFDGIGDLSGDWGGGNAVAMAGLGAAVRARDGRGPRTELERTVPAHFGLTRPAALTRAMYDRRIRMDRLGELSPVVFATARGGDPVARAIIDRLADELATMAIALATRLGIKRLPVDVVLAGGVFRADDSAFFERLDARIRPDLPAANLIRLDIPPVAGAAREGLKQLALDGPEAIAAARERVRHELRKWRP
ncbi:MAG TPA: BadF/BadG/BcrA/BcrD ATPase family protein [Candidatus Dormibacteraeota bacterium]|nr:BadF/BadG/BcrA/BcrD ATPase family protein [Candidatus Dormibacteraeota bacterium]